MVYGIGCGCGRWCGGGGGGAFVTDRWSKLWRLATYQNAAGAGMSVEVEVEIGGGCNVGVWIIGGVDSAVQTWTAGECQAVESRYRAGQLRPHDAVSWPAISIDDA